MTLKEAFNGWAAECAADASPAELERLEGVFFAGAGIVHRAYGDAARMSIVRQRRRMATYDAEIRTFAVEAALRHASRQGAGS